MKNIWGQEYQKVHWSEKNKFNRFIFKNDFKIGIIIGLIISIILKVKGIT